MKGDELAERLLVFGANVVRLCDDVKGSVAGRHIVRQLIRAASAGGAIYEEARGAESRADFIHKIAMATKETHESLYWLNLIERSALATGLRLLGLVDEARQLVAIFTASGKTAKRG